MVEIELVDLDAVLPSWEDLEQSLPQIGEPSFQPETRGPRDRAFFDKICDAYATSGRETCADTLLETQARALALPKEDRVSVWTDTFREFGIDPNAPAPNPQPETGTPDVQGPQTWGPQKWKELEAWAESIPCPPCRDFSEMAASGIHDAVNVQLGKPVYDRENLQRFVVLMNEAARKAGVSQ